MSSRDHKKHPQCPYNHVEYFERQSKECWNQCRLENEELYAECVELSYGDEQAARILGKSQRQEHPPQSLDTDPPLDTNKANPTETTPEEHKPTKKDNKTLLPNEKWIRNKLEQFEHFNEDWKSKCYEEALEEVVRLRHSNRVKKGKLAKLKVGFNRKLFEGKKRMVVMKYAEAILVYLILRPDIVKESEKDNEGKKSFEFLFETDGKRLAEWFGISHRKGLEIIKQLVRMGAWKKVKMLKAKHVIYRIGERKYTGGGYTDSFYFKPKNPRVEKFFNTEKNKQK